MADEWRRTTIGGLCDAGIAELQTGPFGSQLHAHEYVEDGVPVVPTEAIRKRRIDHSVLPHVELSKAEQLSRHRLRAGDILFARRGAQAAGHVGYVGSDEEGFLCGTGAIRLRIDDSSAEVDSEYLSHVLANPTSTAWFKNHAIGATMPNLNEGIIRSFPITVPPLSEQRAIARILGTLDNKIELTGQITDTLKAIARAVFKSWLVDFDPVHAKAEGRDTGLPDHVAGLFPDQLIESELGEVPAGWERGSLGSFVSQRSERVGPREVVVLSTVASGKLVKSDDHFTKRVYSTNTEKYLLVEHGDFAYNPARINIGSVGMLEDEVLGGVSPVYVVVRPAPAFRWFLEFTLRRPNTKMWINTLASGSVRQSLSYTNFASIPCVVPPEAVVQEFNCRWADWRAGILSREAECRTLAALRDTLLPKLTSGEIRVRNAESFLERAL